MTALRLALVAAVALLPACKKEGERHGLPPASQWHEPSQSASTDDQGSADDNGADMAAGELDDNAEMPDDEVHAGMGGGGMAGGAMGANPHGGAMGGANPHGGMAGAPDPNRPIDESRVLAGTITVKPDLAKLVKPGMVLYVSAKPPGTKDCVVTGVMPAASLKIDAPALPQAFKLTEREVMMAGAGLTGEFLVCAHLSTTGDASKKVPGDLFGSVKATVPAKELGIVLETTLP